MNEMMNQMMTWTSDHLPMVMSMPPITAVALGITALGALFYYITRTPELLLVMLTAGMYAFVPLVHHVF